MIRSLFNTRLLFNTRKLLFLQLCLIILSVIFTSSSAYAKQIKKALIIGNADYRAEIALKNPINDARLMNETLSDKGFETTLITNANLRQMKTSIQAFSRDLTEDSVGLFYFAGHGLEVDGSNYLLPIGANIDSESDVEYEAINAARILSGFKNANNGLNILILDACRNNPYASSFRSYSSRGLAPMRPSSGALVLYATEPGSVASDNVDGNNGLFTGHLVNAMNIEGLRIEDVFKRTANSVYKSSNKKQTPYLEGVILGDFVFSPQSKVQPIVKSIEDANKITPPQSTNNANDMERYLWSNIEKTKVLGEYEAYLEMYPDGFFKPLANTRIAQLKKAATTTAAKIAVAEQTQVLEQKQKQALEQALEQAKKQKQALEQALEQKQKQALEQALAQTLAQEQSDDIGPVASLGNVTNNHRKLNTSEIDKAIMNFDLLKNAIENRNLEKVNLLTEPSELRKNMFSYLFNNFVKIEIALDDISIQHSNKVIAAKLKINMMHSANGDRSLPSSDFKEIALTSEFQNNKWSKISW